MTAQGISYRDSSSRALTPLRYDYKLPDSLNRKPWPSVPSLAVLAITIIVRNLDRIDVNPNAVPLNLAKKVVAVAAEQSNGWESIPVEIRWKFLRAYGPSIASHSTKMIKDAVVDLHIDIPVPVNQFLDLLISAHSSFPLLSHPPPLSSAVGIFITTLSLARTSITDTTVSPVARLTFLTALDLSFTLLTNYGVGQFRPRNACSAPEERRGLWMLRSLILKGCRGINERVGKDLKTFRGLNFIGGLQQESSAVSMAEIRLVLDVSMTPAGQQLSTLRHILNSASDRSNSSLRSPVRKWRTATSPLSGNTYEKQESTSLIVTSVKLSHASLSQPSKATPVKLAALNREAIDIEELLAPSSISASVESLEEMSTRKKMK